MDLPYPLISEFAKIVNSGKKQSDEATIYGEVIDENGNKYVRPDGSDQLIPITENDDDIVKGSSTTNMNAGDRVSVLIKDHTATVTGNISAPSTSDKDIINKINEYDTIITKQIQADKAYFEKVIADKASVGELEAAKAEITELDAKKASVEDLDAANAEITNLKATKIDADAVEAKYATIENLEATNLEVGSVKGDLAEFEEATVRRLDAAEADIKDLDVENLDNRYANIDFANITEATIRNFFTKTGMIENVVIGNSTITGALVGVTIKGDLVEAGTLKADKLVILGEDGLYYKLNVNTLGETTASSDKKYQNGIHGDIILANTITAEKIDVKDLVAFGATIGGFKIGSNSIYSGSKESIDNTTRGIYMDTDAQFAVGDSDNYIKYSKVTDENGESKAYRMRIASEDVATPDDIGLVKKDISAVSASTTEIRASVSSLETKTTDLTDDIQTLREQVDLKVTKDGVQIEIQKAVDDGVKKVDTKTGVKFDEDGMLVDKDNSQTATQITENGMVIKSKELPEDSNKVLTANKDGVNAKNLHATTYLIIGGRSRFENYPNNRTACFWIGE